MIYFCCRLWHSYPAFTSDSVLSYSSQNFEKNAQDPADSAEPWFQDPSGFLPILMGFKSFHQRNPLSYNTL